MLSLEHHVPAFCLLEGLRAAEGWPKTLRGSGGVKFHSSEVNYSILPDRYERSLNFADWKDSAEFFKQGNSRVHPTFD